jgi:hypothetical protein
VGEDEETPYTLKNSEMEEFKDADVFVPVQGTLSDLKLYKQYSDNTNNKPTNQSEPIMLLKNLTVLKYS